MNWREKKIKQQLENELYPHFNENYEVLQAQLAVNEKEPHIKPRHRLLPIAVSGMVALAAVMLAWGVYRGGLKQMPIESSYSSAISTQTNTVTTTGTKPSQTKTSDDTKGTASGSGIRYEKSSIQNAESKMQMLLPDLSSFGIKEYQLAMRGGEPIAFHYVLNHGYVEIRKQPLKTAGLSPITIDNHHSYLDRGLDYVRLIAEDKQLFYDIYVEQSDGQTEAEEILTSLLNFYKE
ncbi:MAG: hypothetical protein PHX02_05260 [Oscillospiraceae bacterium]|jgi:hypothetical protein|nr:hypothetical protein [Oscillospiraceae bacterium]